MSQQNAGLLTIDYSLILQSEPMNNIDKYSILSDTNKFNDSKILNQNSKPILLKLVYLLNQGQSFSDQELELLFFRVTKLLQSNNSVLKGFTYATLKMIGAQKYIHMLMQSLINDLINTNPLIRIEALRFVSVIQEEQYILQIERFIHKAILDNNIEVSDTALIVGINIINRFPNIVKKWQYDILFLLNQQQHLNYHALILLHELQKKDKILFLNILKTQQPQQTLVNLQILQFIKHIFKKSELRQDLIPFIILSIHQQEVVTFLESIDILAQHQEILKANFQQIIMRFNNILSLNAQLIEICSALKKFEFLIIIFGQSEQELDKLMIKIENLTNYKYVSISYRSLLICINQQTRDQDKYLQKLFNLKKLEKFQYNFLEGLLELLEFHSKYGAVVLNTMKIIIFRDSSQLLKLMAIQIISDILKDSILNYQIALEILFRLPQPSEIDSYFFVVQTISQIFFKIIFRNLEQSRTYQCFQYLKGQFQNKKTSFVDIQSKRYKQIKKQLLQIIQTDLKKNRLMDQHQNQNILQDINK